MARNPFRRYRRFWGSDPRRDVDEELAFHLAMRAEEFRRAGMSDEAAEEATMTRFGNVDQIRSEVEELAVKRSARRHRALTMDALIQDVRFAVRTLIANPGYSIVVALTLGLGIGANAAVFSVAYGVLLRPLPYTDAGNLVRVWSRLDKSGLEFFSVSPLDFDDWRRETKTMTAMAAFERQRDATLTAGDRPQSISITSVTPETFSLLGTQPEIGRALVPSDALPEAPLVGVISHNLWATSFGSDRSIVGRDILVDGRKVTVVGVMPSRFSVPGTNAELWNPHRLNLSPDQRGNRFLRVLGRLAPGATPEMVVSELNGIVARTERDAGASYGWTTNIMLVPEMVIGKQFRRAVLVLIGVVAFVLLIACANAANLQLARAASRGRELAVRVALGASRGRVARQLLTESGVVAAVAGAIGLALAYGGVALLRALGDTTVPRLEDVKLDMPVLLFTAAVALGSGMLFGLIPALRASRADVANAMKHGGRGAGQGSVASGVRGTLVVVEISLTLVLLIGAGLLMRSLAHLQAVDVGFDEHGLLVARMQLPQSTYPTPQSTAQFYGDVLSRAAAIGGVRSVALVSSAPFAGPSPSFAFMPTDKQLTPGAVSPNADYRHVSTGYLQTMGIRLVRGRDIQPTDREGAPLVALASMTLVNSQWPNGDAIGKQIRLGDIDKGPVATIVGIVDDVRYQSLEGDRVRPMLYFSWYLSPQRSMTLVTRTASSGVAASLLATLAAVDRRLPAPTITPMPELVQSAMASRRFAMTLLGIFAVTALALAVIGLYGVLSYMVKLRAHELGIRVALGASRSRLLGLVVFGALRLTVIGIAIGLDAAYWLTKLLGSLLFDVSPTDAATFAALSTLLAAVTIAGSLIPAMRATRADPMLALREEG